MVKRRYSGAGSSSKRRRVMGLPVFRQAAGLAMRAGASYIRKKFTKPRDNVTTGQFDYRTQYVKKKMPYRKKKRWVRQVKINRALDLKNQGLKTVVFNDSILRTTAGTQGQNLLNFCLYGVKGNADSPFVRAGYRDLYRIFKNEPSISKSTVGEPKGGKIFFGSAILDVTLRNTGGVDVEVDVYYGYHYKNPSGQVGDLVDGYLDDSAPLIAPGNTIMTITNRGVTPFDLTEQTANQRFTIRKKQKFYLPVGKSVFIQHRDAKNRIMDWENLAEYPENTTGYAQYAKPWTTYDVLVVFKKVVGTGDADAYQLTAGVTRKYSYSILSQNTDAQALGP